MNRRDAIKSATIMTNGLLLSKPLKSMEGFISERKDLKKINYGVQLFTVPHMVEADLKSTLQTISEIGYKEIEFFGPYPSSSDAAKEQFKQVMGALVGLNRHAFFGYSLEDTIKILEDNDLKAPSMHVSISTLRSQLDQIAETGNRLGAKYLIIAAVFENRNSLDGYKLLADEFNQFGEQLSKYGLTFAYHNHGYEHQEMDDQIPMNYLVENTDPDYVQFELDIFWMKAAGADPIDYLMKYPDRFKLLHLKDCKEEFRFSGDGSTPDQWMKGFPKMTDPGDGVYNIKKIIEVAQKVGVAHFYLERDMAPDALTTLKNSFTNLKKMS